MGIVVITHNRRAELARTLRKLETLPDRGPVVVVDNASHDDTAAAVRQEHPWVQLIACRENLGAVGRNIGVERLRSPYVAFCDDDTWWEPGSLAAAEATLDAHPDVAVLTARIIVEPAGTEDPIVAELRESPVRGRPGLPGPALGSFLAGASVVRRSAFRAAGGFHPRLWLGGEEELLAADLAAAGWELCYLPQATVHHQASVERDTTKRQRDGVRNTLWFTWLRRPLPAAVRRTAVVLAQVRPGPTLAGVVAALRGLPWVLRERRVLPARAEARFRVLEESQRRSTARRYS